MWNKRRLTYLCLTISVLILATMPLNAYCTLTNLSPTADTWVESKNPDQNKGDDAKQHVRVELDSQGQVTNLRRSYLKFDLSGLPTGVVIVSAVLHLYGTKIDAVPSAYQTTDGWTESGLTYANQPSPIGAFVADGVSESNQWYKWTITTYVASEFAGDKTLSLLMKFTTESGNKQHFDFKSPSLEISYQGISVVPEVPIGTIAVASIMAIAVAAYVGLTQWHKRPMPALRS